MQHRHPDSGQYINKPSAPRVVGGPAPVSAPIPHGPLSPAGNLDDYSRAEIVKEAARRSTEQGGTIQQRAEEIAKERGVSIDPTFNPLAGI